MSTILIARHGNTFDKGETAVRVGLRTDLALSVSGTQQAINLGHYFKQHKLKFAAVFTSNLKRTKETASIALATADLNTASQARSMFDEVDYGVDEGKTNEEIIARIGEHALQDWESIAVPPTGWNIDVEQIVRNWKDFADEISSQYPNKTVLVVTSNGIARFAPYLTANFLAFSQNHKLKLATGALGSLSFRDGAWNIDFWNEVPAAVYI